MGLKWSEKKREKNNERKVRHSEQAGAFTS